MGDVGGEPSLGLYPRTLVLPSLGAAFIGVRVDFAISPKQLSCVGWSEIFACWPDCEILANSGVGVCQGQRF
jgi:hypothetical protein